MLLEALNRHRGKGQQKVTVEHVHVNAGGQAVVGTVEAPRRAGENSEDRQGAKQIGYAPQPVMSTTSERESPGVRHRARCARPRISRPMMECSSARHRSPRVSEPCPDRTSVTPVRCARARAAGPKPAPVGPASRQSLQESGAVACMAGPRDRARRMAIRTR
jgi:hypothetical protein